MEAFSCCREELRDKRWRTKWEKKDGEDNCCLWTADGGGVAAALSDCAATAANAAHAHAHAAAAIAHAATGAAAVAHAASADAAADADAAT